jgi:deferrochelatase/peroxidase EfeB
LRKTEAGDHVAALREPRTTMGGVNLVAGFRPELWREVVPDADHGTMFVGFSADQRPLITMLESMAELTDGVRDALTHYTQPLTGAYYFVPSTESLRRHRRVNQGAN